MLSLLITAPEPPAFLLPDGKYLTSSHRKFSCIISSMSTSHLTVCIHLDDIFGDPATFTMLICTPYPDPCRIIVPGAGFFAGDFPAIHPRAAEHHLGGRILRQPADVARVLPARS